MGDVRKEDVSTQSFTPREAMSHSDIIHAIAANLVKFLTLHETWWWMDRHYMKCGKKKGKCGCCAAQKAMSHQKAMDPGTCSLCANAWLLSTLTKEMSLCIWMHGMTRPRHWWKWPAAYRAKKQAAKQAAKQIGYEPQKGKGDMSGAECWLVPRGTFGAPPQDPQADPGAGADDGWSWYGKWEWQDDSDWQGKSWQDNSSSSTGWNRRAATRRPLPPRSA